MDDALGAFLRALRRLSELTGHPIVLVGGLARGVWARPRATQDTTVVYGGPDLDAIIEAAPAVGLTVNASEVASLAQSGMTRLRHPGQLRGPVRLDVIHGAHPYYQRLAARAVPSDELGTSVVVARPEDLIVLKLLAARRQDLADVEAILDAQAGALDAALIRAELETLEVDLPGWVGAWLDGAGPS